MNTSSILHAAEKALLRLIEECSKDGPMFRANPKTVIQVNRTSKWLLSAIAQLRKPTKEER